MTLFFMLYLAGRFIKFKVIYAARYCDIHNHLSYSWVTLLIIKISRTFKTDETMEMGLQH